mmetsp:Transcript_1523/g.2449  ORF Transcript_1523/g.2449 Transcript_1523/m.2449 type:complete len:362 (-) Transcript_1523:134-1219(-)
MLSVSEVVLGVIVFALGAVVGGFISYLQSFQISSARADQADERRRRCKALIFPVPTDIEHIRQWTPNSRGMLLFRQQFIPHGVIRGVIGICHGFGDHSQDFLTELAVKFCRNGFAVITMDVEGHGLSDGLHGHISKLSDVVEDVSEYFLFETSKEKFRTKPFFIYGESMGGAVAFNLCTVSPARNIIRGVILVAPMVDVADEMKLPEFVISVLKIMAYYIPLAAITPVPDIIDRCYKDPATRIRSRSDVLSYQALPRLGTALAMLLATQDMAKRLHELETPVLIVHGDADVVTCPKVSTALFDNCQSSDKSIKIYPDCWHGLMRGEYEPTASEIFQDVLQWLLDRTDTYRWQSPRKCRSRP